MKSRLTPSEDERRLRRLDAPTRERAGQLMADHGAIHVQAAFDVDLLTALRASVNSAALESTDAVKSVGDGRTMYSLRVAPPFDEPELYANPLCMDILQDLFPPHGFVLNSFGAVVAGPGAPAQHAHVDGGRLFPGAERPPCPSHAITMLVPLDAMSLKTGTTRIWEGSHLLADNEALTRGPSMVESEFGDCILMDYRVWHSGTTVASTRERVVMYMVYSRPWFRDYRNFPSHHVVTLPKAIYSAVPDDLKSLFRLAALS